MHPSGSLVSFPEPGGAGRGPREPGVQVSDGAENSEGRLCINSQCLPDPGIPEMCVGGGQKEEVNMSSGLS